MKPRKSDPKFVLAYDRGMLRSAFVSLFWGIIMERRKHGAFTLLGLARLLGTNKAEVSRWFNGSPNWTLNTITAIANALNVDLRIEAVDRTTGQVFTSAGLVQTAAASSTSQIKSTAIVTTSMRGREQSFNPIIIPPGMIPNIVASVSAIAA